jgi:hypothetical protein
MGGGPLAALWATMTGYFSSRGRQKSAAHFPFQCKRLPTAGDARPPAVAIDRLLYLAGVVVFAVRGFDKRGYPDHAAAARRERCCPDVLWGDVKVQASVYRGARRASPGDIIDVEEVQAQSNGLGARFSSTTAVGFPRRRSKSLAWRSIRPQDAAAGA